MESTLSDIEQKILDYMVAYLRTHTYQPSIREIGEQFGIRSTKTVSEHLQSLADKGFVERDPARSRGVKILGMDLDPQTISVPSYLTLPRDRNGLRVDRADEYLSIDRKLVGRKGCFFVRAQDSTLSSEGIQAGDYVLIEPVLIEEVPDRAVVAVRIGHESSFRRLGRNGRGVYLDALDGQGDPLYIEEPGRLEMLGRVSAFYRKLDSTETPSPYPAH